MIPDEMLDKVGEEQRDQFFVRDPNNNNQWTIKQKEDQTGIVIPSTNPSNSLMTVLANRINQNQNQQGAMSGYAMFVDLIYKMLIYNPEQRITPQDCMLHPFITTELGSGAREARPRDADS